MGWISLGSVIKRFGVSIIEAVCNEGGSSTELLMHLGEREVVPSFRRVSKYEVVVCLEKILFGIELFDLVEQSLLKRAGIYLM
eukprot:8797877-Ditylum_brightwellii.AAC.1